LNTIMRIVAGSLEYETENETAQQSPEMGVLPAFLAIGTAPVGMAKESRVRQYMIASETSCVSLAIKTIRPMGKGWIIVFCLDPGIGHARHLH
jgi:hypothetical protein